MKGGSGYSGTPLLKKLGVKDGSTLVLVGEPRGVIGEIPASVTVRRQARGSAMLSEGATDMDGPSLAPILIPITGTLLLIAWLVLVFLAGRHAERAGVRSGTDPR